MLTMSSGIYSSRIGPTSWNVFKLSKVETVKIKRAQISELLDKISDTVEAAQAAELTRNYIPVESIVQSRPTKLNVMNSE